MIKIQTLLENENSRNHSLLSEHGLSFFVIIDDKKFLFDCSGGDKFIKNAEKLGINLNEVDTVILSHSHYDHCCGFLDLIKYFKISKLITGYNFFNPKYSFDGVKYTYLGCGFDKKLLEKNTIEHIECGDILKLHNNIFLIGNFNRKFDFEKSPNRFVVDDSKEIIKDDFRDEICLVINTEKGLVVITGCSHPGILNILTTIQQRLNKNIYAVFGGTHLVEADEIRCLKTIDEMEKLKINIVGFSHCSGELILNLIKENENFISCRLNTGDMIKI
ncbi:MAG: MBL fold metallo-hydrolase [Fusobacterium perfoetens]|uniref:MBL fold metallo-hydrolase n=1 Tax=Fusobacterium perfoetens TaxID=852 RepID=UPI0023F35256|nr:MBL fold metallo-hydrolase [Fusobacterium perfoetens]MCI6152106.1 MBL fold metallo-hydrolase [Fusobacterium perfoetens]MDY3238003.1 MBL fold metallo-hydrolase [Fusobacterium perfoetens]